jgi:hypothetical protein
MQSNYGTTKKMLLTLKKQQVAGRPALTMACQEYEQAR